MNFREIWEGWRNDALPPEKLKESIRLLAAERLEICRACPINSINMAWKDKSILSKLRPDEHCTNCLCTLSKKTKVPKAECPLDPPKWRKVLEEKEMTSELFKLVDEVNN